MLVNTLATLSLVNAVELRDLVAVTFVTFLVPVDPAHVQAVRGKTQKYHTQVAHDFRALIKATLMVKWLPDVAGAVVKTLWAEWLLKKDAMELAAAVRR